MTYGNELSLWLQLLIFEIDGDLEISPVIVSQIMCWNKQKSQIMYQACWSDNYTL